jgi:hypothetical protein
MKKLLLALFLALAISPAFAQNAGGAVFKSGASTAASRQSGDFTNLGGKCGILVIDITVFATGTFTFTLQGKDGASGKYYTVLASTALNSTGTTLLKVCPGLTAAANATANDLWPMVWRVSVAGASTPSATYSVGYNILD